MLSVRTDRPGRVIEFDYDDAGRPTEERWKLGASIVNTIQFTYDPDGRIATTGDDHSRYAYQYDLNGGMTEVENEGTPGVPRVILSAQYNRLVERTSLAATVGGTNDFLNSYGYDALGRAAWITQDANGGHSAVNHLQYDAFGRITGQSNAALTPLFAFTGRDWDPDAELLYYRARWYDAAVGRFLSEDPIGFHSGDDNLYRYVMNSPVMMVDPDGMAAPVVVIGGALVGIVVACAFPYHLYSLNHHGGRSDKFRHCWVSCAVRRTCSGYVAEFAGLGKEVRDRMIAAYCAAFPDHAICKGGHGDFWDSLADIAANQQCLAWEQFVFGAVGGWIGALCRESCEDCCSREIGN